jgi:flagellin-specific chaperone FliS
MANKILLNEAMNKITIELINSLDYGEEIKLNKKYTLYHYCEDDIIVLNETKNWEEVFQIMTKDEEIIFEKL